MAFKIARYLNKITVIGAPSSAGARHIGPERAPAAFRTAGLIEKLRNVGFEVSDAGDVPQEVFEPDPEHPRAQNAGRVVKVLERLKPLVEQAVRAGTLPILLGGDCTISMAAVAGVRRYYRDVCMIYLDRDADLNTPQTTPSGILDGMVVAHLTGRGAPELVRFSAEPPLVREPDLALFGLVRLDPPEEQWLARSPLRVFTAEEIQRKGAAASAEQALERVHAERKQVCLHFDVDVISSEEIPGGDVADSGGLGLAAVREALESFARAPNLSAVSITEYNPDRDPEAKAAAVITDLFVAALAQRLVKKEPEEVKEVVAAEAAEPAAAAPAETISEALAEAPSTEEAVLPAESPAPPAAEPEAEQAPPAPPTAEAEAGQPVSEEGAVVQETAPPVLETAEPAAVETTAEQEPEPAVSSQPSEGTEAPQPEAEGEPSEAPKPPSE